MTKTELSEHYANQKVLANPRNAFIGYSWDTQKKLTTFDGYDIEQAYEDGFDAGRADAVESIWHKKTERPTKETTCILIATHGGFMARERVEQMEDWQRWAYIEDLLPNIPEPLEVVKSFCMEELKEDSV